MLKRLLIAVFVLSLIAAFSGSALSDVPNDVTQKTLPSYDGSARGAVVPNQYVPKALQRGADDAQTPYYNFVTPPYMGSKGADTVACYEQDYFDWVNATFVYTWTRGGGDPRELAMKFSIGQLDHYAEVEGSWIWLYGSEDLNTVDGIDVQLTMYGIAGGLPDDGNILHTEVVTIPDMGLSTGGGWFYVTFTGGPIASTGEYFIGGKNVDADVDDKVQFTSDDGGDGGAIGAGRSYYRDGTDLLFYKTTDYFVQPFDPNFAITSVQCEYYSSCYYNIPAIANFYGASMPRATTEADGSIRNGWGQRFVANGPETLVVVDIWHYSSGLYAGSNETNALEVSVWGDLAGSIDVGSGPIATVTIPAGLANLYPYTADLGGWDVATADFSSLNLVVFGPYHITAKLTSNNAADGGMLPVFSGPGELSDGSVNYDATEPWVLTGSSANWTDPADADLWACGWDIEPYLCKDEFSVCETQELGDWATALGLTGYGLPPYPGAAQRVKGQAVNRLEAIRVMPIDPALFGEVGGTPTMAVNVYTDGGGLPGTLVWADTIAFADIGYYPGWTEVVIPTAEQPQLVGDFYIGYGNVSADPVTDWFRFGALTGGVEINDGAFYYSTGSMAWLDLGDLAGEATNWVMEADFCGIPFSERECDPLLETGWATFQGDAARTGASQLPLGDAWCDLDLNWSYLDPTNGVSFTEPVIYGNLVVCSFTDHYVLFDITTGGVITTLDNTLGDGQLIGDQIRSAPLLTNLGGTDYMFFAGGQTNGVGCFDLGTLSLIWQRTILSVGPAGVFGLTRFSPFIVLDQGGTPVLYYGTDAGRVAAVEALTGNLYAGWATNPVQLTGGTFNSGATDGSQLYYSTSLTVSGDVYAIDAATGVINWQLTAAGGLQATSVFTEAPPGNEHFTSGVSVDVNTGEVFAGSRIDRAGNPAWGVFYFLDAASGNLSLPAQQSNPTYYTTPIVDRNAIYLPTFPIWSDQPVAAGELLSFGRQTGALNWAMANANGGIYYTTGLLTCEPEGGEDQIYLFDSDGFLECVSSVTGEQIFRRRIDHPGGALDLGMGGALAEDAGGITHLVFADYWGGLYDLTKTGVDRPRLEVQSYNINVPVEFGTDPNYLVDAGPLAVNTGCAPLTFGATVVDEADITGAELPDFVISNIDNDYMARAEKIADDMQRDAFLSKFVQLKDGIALDEDLSISREFTRDNATRTYSAGIPAWFVSLVHPVNGDILPAGDTMNLEFTVNQPMISRGPQDFYLSLPTDDPDFYLNAADDNPGLIPQVHVTVIGGCLIDSISLFFGTGGTNVELVTNTGRLGTGDWDPHGFDIDGDAASYYQGAYIYANGTYSIAVHTQDWTSGGGEADAFISMQPDPDFCDDECAPLITSGVSVGAIWDDMTMAYVPITADMVCKSFIDSVQNFAADPLDPITTWDWSAFGGPFDDTLTMGLTCNSRVFGVTGFEEFNNFTLEIFEFTERNGNPVENWYFSHIVDYDAGNDSVTANFANSVIWDYNQGTADIAWGTIKVPFGCGTVGAGQDFDFNPVINAKGLTGNQALWDWGLYWDSLYLYNTAGAGLLDHQDMNQDDGEVHMTLASHDFAGGDTYSFGIAQFGFGGLTGTDDPNNADIIGLAHFVNKWAGFGRGDVNDDGVINLADIIYLAAYVNNGGPGAVPFEHLGDVNADATIDMADVSYLMTYYFDCGPCPMGDWMF